MTALTATNENPYGSLGLASQAPARNTSLGQADFLRLMTEQLKNQDPLKPLANAEFLGQLAQFSTVQGIENMQGSLGAVASVMESDQALRAASLVGREALVQVSTVALQPGAPLRGEVTAPSAGPVTIEIVDSSGAIVRRTSVNAPSSGPMGWEWDGKDEAGNPSAGGTYTVRASIGTGDRVEALSVRVAARIDSVSIEPQGLVINLDGLGSHPLSAIRRVG